LSRVQASKSVEKFLQSIFINYDDKDCKTFETFRIQKVVSICPKDEDVKKHPSTQRIFFHEKTAAGERGLVCVSTHIFP